jgi:hypothetical protein
MAVEKVVFLTKLEAVMFRLNCRMLWGLIGSAKFGEY